MTIDGSGGLTILLLLDVDVPILRTHVDQNILIERVTKIGPVERQLVKRLLLSAAGLN